MLVMRLAECVELGRLYQLLLACKQFIGEVAITFYYVEMTVTFKQL